MSWSANEVQALATKAARGAGAPAGQAATFGRAVVCHLCADRPISDVTLALAALPDGPILALPLALAEVLGTSDGTVVKGAITSDMPAFAQSYAQTLPFAHDVSRTDDGITLTVRIDTPCGRAALKRLDLPAPLVALLNDLAARTFVPESDASRLGGAGAGLTDND